MFIWPPHHNYIVITREEFVNTGRNNIARHKKAPAISGEHFFRVFHGKNLIFRVPSLPGRNSAKQAQKRGLLSGSERPEPHHSEYFWVGERKTNKILSFIPGDGTKSP
jgi:hypothetical protein